AEDARDVALDRRLAEEQALRELGVGKPLCEQLQDFELALCEQIEARRGPFVAVRERVGEAVEEPPGDGRGQQRPSRRGDADRVHELRRLYVFEQETAGARSDRLVDVLVEVERR